MDHYALWLLTAPARVEGPIDLVGHDWGGISPLGGEMRLSSIVLAGVSDAAVGNS